MKGYLVNWQRPRQIHPGLATVIEVGILFLPGIPAFLWLWPNIQGTPWYTPVDVFAYLYMLAGSLWIGLRRWTPADLGFNRQGFRLSLVCGLLLLAGRTLVITAVQWPREPFTLNPWQMAGDILFYFGLVALVEEIIFRGLLFHALDVWRGTQWAIWGTTAGFILFHIGWRSPLQLLAALLIGLIFAAIRWRAGGIIGLIIAHGLVDVGAVWLLPELHLEEVGPTAVVYPAALLLGYGLILGIPLYLWLLYPRVSLATAAAALQNTARPILVRMCLALYRPGQLIANYLANPGLRYGLIPYAILVILWSVKNRLAFWLPVTLALDTLLPVPLPPGWSWPDDRLLPRLLLFVGVYAMLPCVFASIAYAAGQLLRLPGVSVRPMTSFFMFIGGTVSLLALLADAIVAFSATGRQLAWLPYAHPLAGIVEIAYLTVFTRRLAEIRWWQATAVVVPAFLASIAFHMLFFQC